MYFMKRKHKRDQTSLPNTLQEKYKIYQKLEREYRIRTMTGFTKNRIVGTQGNNPGEFSGPFDVTMLDNSLIVVADTCNNRIQILKLDGTLVSCFGRKGSSIGEFSFPSGVAVTKDLKIVVADMDNHRIQIFERDGQCIQVFGKEGSAPGKFNKPWSVAVTQNNEILVVDVHKRIQRFSCDGTYLSHFGQDILSYPLCTAVSNDGFIFVSDGWDKQKVGMFDDRGSFVKYIGKGEGKGEGRGLGHFQNIQGVAIDSIGYLYTVDSGLNRIQVFDVESGHCIHSFGTNGSAIGELNDPSGITVTSKGDIIVVERANARLQFFVQEI